MRPPCMDTKCKDNKGGCCAREGKRKNPQVSWHIISCDDNRK